MKIKSLKHDWYKFDYKNLFFNVFYWHKWAKKDKSHRLKQYKYLEEGDEKLTKEIDLVNLIDSIRKVNVLTSILLTEDQRVLLEGQPINQISEDKSEYLSYPKTWEDKLTNDKLIEGFERMKNSIEFKISNNLTQNLIWQILGETNLKEEPFRPKIKESDEDEIFDKSLEIPATPSMPTFKNL